MIVFQSNFDGCSIDYRYIFDIDIRSNFDRLSMHVRWIFAGCSMIGRGLEEGWRKNAMEDAWRRNGGGLSVDHLSNTNDNRSTRESEIGRPGVYFHPNS